MKSVSCGIRSRVFRPRPRPAQVLGVLALLACLASGPLAATAAPERVDINSANSQQLASLPGIGEAKAAAIIKAREQRPFTSVADLRRVSGIGEKTLAELKPRIQVGKTD